MYKRVVIAGTALTAVAAATVAVNAAQASPDTYGHDSGSGGTSQSETHITVVERAVSDKVIDNKPKGDSLGDLLVFGNPVYDKTNSKRVGRDQGSCLRTVVGKAWECSFTTLLADGSLSVQGPFDDTRAVSTLAITGGTGDFSRARGEMHLRAANKKGTAFIFEFVVQN